MMRRIRVSITAEATCDDDRWLSRTVAIAAKAVAAREHVMSGTTPYVFSATIDVPDVQQWSVDGTMTLRPGLPPQSVRVTYVARFKWWHWIVPARLRR